MASGPERAAAPLTVWACVVCFHPDAQTLDRLLRALAHQVTAVILVDNAPEPGGDLAGLASASLVYMPMAANLGTAGALNHAWRHALAHGATHLISFDQDSEPGPTLVAELLKGLNAGIPGTRLLAAVGPVWHDARNGSPLRVLRPVGVRRRHVKQPEHGLVEADHLISSGSLVPAGVYQRVGPFDEGLFLDYVDVEWSLRARSMGYAVAVCASATMKHAIGDDVLRFGGRQLAIHAPARTYLLVRNHLLLWRLPHARLAWLLWDLLLVAAKVTGALLLSPARFTRARWVGRGVIDGLKGREGPPPTPQKLRKS